MLKVLFLGYGSDFMFLIEKIEFRGWEVEYMIVLVVDFVFYDVVISFGYCYIIWKEVLDIVKCFFLNFYILYLFWNRGVYFFFWVLNDVILIGVIIYEIDVGIDIGFIIF